MIMVGEGGGQMFFFVFAYSRKFLELVSLLGELRKGPSINLPKICATVQQAICAFFDQWRHSIVHFRNRDLKSSSSKNPDVDLLVI